MPEDTFYQIRAQISPGYQIHKFVELEYPTLSTCILSFFETLPDLFYTRQYSVVLLILNRQQLILKHSLS